MRRTLADTAIPVHRQVTGALAGLSVRGERVAVRALAVAAERRLVGWTCCQALLSVEAQEVFAFTRCLILCQSKSDGTAALREGSALHRHQDRVVPAALDTALPVVAQVTVALANDAVS